MELKFKIEGLDCPNCASSLEKELSNIAGIKNVSINFISSKMLVETENENIEEIIENIKRLVKDEEPDTTLTEI